MYTKSSNTSHVFTCLASITNSKFSFESVKTEPCQASEYLCDLTLPLSLCHFASSSSITWSAPVSQARSIACMGPPLWNRLSPAVQSTVVSDSLTSSFSNTESRFWQEVFASDRLLLQRREHYNFSITEQCEVIWRTSFREGWRLLSGQQGWHLNWWALFQNSLSACYNHWTEWIWEKCSSIVVLESNWKEEYVSDWYFKNPTFRKSDSRRSCIDEANPCLSIK